MKSLKISAVLFAVILFGACEGKSVNTLEQANFALSQCGSCTDLENYLKEIKIAEMKKQVDYYKKNFSNWGGGYMKNASGTGDAQNASPGLSETGTSDTSQSKSATDYTTTNNQVQGVDEADFIKNDGKYIYTVSNGNFLIYNAYPPEDAVLISKTEIEGYPFAMFIQNKKALIFSNAPNYEYVDGQYVNGAVTKKFGFEGNVWNLLKITMLDISDMTDVQVVKETYLEGYYIDARMVGKGAHVFLTSWLKGPQIKYYPDYLWSCGYGYYYGDYYYGENNTECEKYKNYTKAQWETEFDKLIVDNIAAINSSSLKDWLPMRFDILHSKDGEVKSSGYLSKCEEYYKPSVQNGSGLIDVLSFNFDDPSSSQNSSSVIGNWGTVYGSLQSLYLASFVYDYWYWSWDYQDMKNYKPKTAIHKFDLSDDGASAKYTASGSITGQILNQFSIDEDKAFLRVAATIGGWWNNEDMNNAVYVLGQFGSELQIVGSIEKIALTERIYSARFIGEKGFLVTFRQTDPLFTVDLRDPHNPKIVGELKIPGFSSYLHPMDENHIIGIGRDATDQGQVKGLGLSIFDVSDLANPQQIHKITIGENWATSSLAGYEHLAFTYFAKKDLLAIPLTQYNYYWNGVDEIPFNGLIVFKVTVADGFNETGKVEHKDLYEKKEGDSYYWCTYYNMSVKRSIIMDDYVYSVSGLGIKINDSKNMPETINSLKFPASGDPNNYYGCYYY